MKNMKTTLVLILTIKVCDKFDCKQKEYTFQVSSLQIWLPVFGLGPQRAMDKRRR